MRQNQMSRDAEYLHADSSMKSQSIASPGIYSCKKIESVHLLLK